MTSPTNVTIVHSIATAPSPPLSLVSFNCQSLRSQTRLDYLKAFLQEHSPDVVCLQETHHQLATGPALPPGYVSLFSDGRVYHGRRGVAILAKKTTLLAHGLRLHLHANITTPNFQLLAAKLGSTLVISAYVFTDGPDPPASTFLAMVDEVMAIRGPSSPPLVLAGDFNHPGLHPDLHALLAARPELVPLFPPDFVTRPLSSSALDNIFFTRGLNMGPSWTLNPESDHLALAGRAERIFLRSDGPRRARRHPFPLIRWQLLLPPSDPAHHQQHVDTLSGIKTSIQALSPLADLATYEARLLSIAQEALGTSPSIQPYLEPWMAHPAVQFAYKQLTRARRAFHVRSTRRNRLNRARRSYAFARRQAQDRLHANQLQKINEGGMDIFHRAYRRHASPATSSATAHLAEEPTVAFWTRLFTRDPASPGPPPSEWAPLTADLSLLHVSEEEVAAAISAMAIKTAGPGHLHVRFLKTFSADLAPHLASYFTSCLRTGLPASLKQGSTTLLPKDPSHPSQDPARYRPITVLPAITRLFYKVVDSQLRSLVLSNGTLSLAQAGFLPRRSTTGQAFILETLRTTIRSFRGLFFGAFLDIEKAFDSIPHEDLLFVLRDVIRLPLHWVEAIRLLLIGNTTTIFGHRIAVTRGCLQGAPLSPLLCLFYLEDLCRYLHNQGPIPDFPLGNRAIPGCIRHHWLLLCLLLFADDISLLGITQRSMNWLLMHTSDWMDLRRLRVSPQSEMLLLAATPADLATLPTFSIGGMDLSWAPSFCYLGHPLIAYAPHQRTDYVRRYTPADFGSFLRSLSILRTIFTSTSGTTIVSPRILIIGIKQYILMKALYAAPVVHLDITQLERKIYKNIRRILCLTPDTNKIFINLTLNLWPLNFYIDRRILMFALSFHQSWFFLRVIQPLLALPDTSSARRAILRNGPYHRMCQTLDRYHLSVLDMKEGPDFLSSTSWKTIVDAAIWREFLTHFVTTLTAYPASYIAHYHSIGYDTDATETITPGYPTYLRLGDHFGSIALRYLAYSLRRLDQPRHQFDRPACHWCGVPYSECGIHLIKCRRIPPRFGGPLHRVLCSIWFEADHHRTLSTFELQTTHIGIPAQTASLRMLQRLQWPHMGRVSLIRALQLVGRLIGAYRADWRPSDPHVPQDNPIWPIYIPRE